MKYAVGVITVLVQGLIVSPIFAQEATPTPDPAPAWKAFGAAPIYRPDRGFIRDFRSYSQGKLLLTVETVGTKGRTASVREEILDTRTLTVSGQRLLPQRQWFWSAGKWAVSRQGWRLVLPPSQGMDGDQTFGGHGDSEDDYSLNWLRLISPAGQVQVLKQLPLFSEVLDLRFTPDGKEVLALTSHQLWRYNISTGRAMRVVRPGGGKLDEELSGPKNLRQVWVNDKASNYQGGAALTPDGRHILGFASNIDYESYQGDGRLDPKIYYADFLLYDAYTGKIARRIPAPKRPNYGSSDRAFRIRFTADGRYFLAEGPGWNDVRCVRLHDGQTVNRFDWRKQPFEHSRMYSEPIFSANGYAFVDAEDADVVVRSVLTGEVIRRAKGALSGIPEPDPRESRLKQDVCLANDLSALYLMPLNDNVYDGRLWRWPLVQEGRPSPVATRPARVPTSPIQKFPVPVATVLRAIPSFKLPTDWREFSHPRALAWSRDGRRLAIGALEIAVDDDGLAEKYTIQIWDVASRRLLRRLDGKPLAFQSEEPVTLAFSPSGETLAAYYEGFYSIPGLVLWNVSTGTVRRQWYVEPQKNRQEAVSIVGGPLGAWTTQAEFRYLSGAENANDEALYWLTLNRLLPRGDAISRRGIVSNEGTGKYVVGAMSADGTYIAAWTPKVQQFGGTPGIFRINVDTKRMEARPLPSVRDGFQPHLTVAADGTTAALLTTYSTIQVFHFASTPRGVTSIRTVRPCSKFALSPDGKLLAIQALSGKITLWSAQGDYLGFVGQSFVGHRQPLGGNGASTHRGDEVGSLRRIAFSPDGGQLAVCGDDGTVSLFSLPTIGVKPAGSAWLHSGSRMSGDAHVRFYEGAGVTSSRATLPLLAPLRTWLG